MAEVSMNGGNSDYKLILTTSARPVSGGVEVTAVLKWRRTGSTGYTSHSGGASYSITIGTGSGNRIDGGYNFNAGAGGAIAAQTIRSWSRVITAGSSVNVTGTFNSDTSAAGSGSISVSQSIAFASRPTFVGGASFDAGAAVTINTNRQSTAYLHDITFRVGDATGWIGQNVAGSIAWTPDLELLEQFPNSGSLGGYIRVITKQGSTTVGETYTNFTLRAPASSGPTVTAVTAYDTNQTVRTAIGAFVQGLSRIQLTVDAAGKYGASVKSSSLIIGDRTIQGGETYTPSQAGNISVVGRATDSRGKTGETTGQLTVLAYQPPSVTRFTVTRVNSTGTPDDEGAYLRVDVKAAATSLVNNGEKNSVTVQVDTKEHGQVLWTPRQTFGSGLTVDAQHTVTGGGIFISTKSWDVRIRVSDKLTTAVHETTVATATVTLDLNGPYVGVGKIHEDGALDVGPGGIRDDGYWVLNTSKLATTADLASGVPGKLVTADLAQTLPDPLESFANNTSNITIDQNTWGNIAGGTGLTFGTLPRPLTVRINFSAVASSTVSSVYSMIGAACTGGLTLAPEESQNDGEKFHQTPFTATPEHNTISSWKTVTIPAGPATTIWLQVRRNGETGTQRANYGRIEITPLRWA
ncbi:DUF859 family phage minor structural protein [Microbacterium sp. YY-01]|uniref:DUF859 family phage minor structural protein n=1 Tax=Microbacterium sp. YY-01 TaxID=3421634 RepID=UPI003D165044